MYDFFISKVHIFRFFLLYRIHFEITSIFQKIQWLIFGLFPFVLTIFRNNGLWCRFSKHAKMFSKSSFLGLKFFILGIVPHGRYLFMRTIVRYFFYKNQIFHRSKNINQKSKKKFDWHFHLYNINEKINYIASILGSFFKCDRFDWVTIIIKNLKKT